MKPCAVFVTGKKESGKTVFVQRLARLLYLRRNARVYILAPVGGITVHGVRIVNTSADLLELRNGESFVCEPDHDDTAASVLAYAFTAGRGWLIVDEADLYCDPAGSDPYLMRAIRYGRHRGLGLVTVSQRPANVNRNLTAQADWLVCFRMEEPRDLLALAPRIGSDNVDRVRDLEPHHALVFPGGLELPPVSLG